MNEKIAAKMEAAKDRRIAELEAEVQRFRLKAEAWDALEAYRLEQRRGTLDEQDEARRLYVISADRARIAARKAQEAAQ